MRYLQHGVTIHDAGTAATGYTLFAPLLQREAYLIDMAGEVVHQWDIPGQPGNYAKLQPNGNLLVSTWSGGGPKPWAARPPRSSTGSPAAPGSTIAPPCSVGPIG